MDIDYTVAALMFPNPLMMTMCNRFHTLSALIRKIYDQYTFEKKFHQSGKINFMFLTKEQTFQICYGVFSFGFI